MKRCFVIFVVAIFLVVANSVFCQEEGWDVEFVINALVDTGTGCRDSVSFAAKTEEIDLLGARVFGYEPVPAGRMGIPVKTSISRSEWGPGWAGYNVFVQPDPGVACMVSVVYRVKLLGIAKLYIYSDGRKSTIRIKGVTQAAPPSGGNPDYVKDVLLSSGERSVQALSVGQVKEIYFIVREGVLLEGLDVSSFPVGTVMTRQQVDGGEVMHVLLSQKTEVTLRFSLGLLPQKPIPIGVFVMTNTAGLWLYRLFPAEFYRLAPSAKSKLAAATWGKIKRQN